MRRKKKEEKEQQDMRDLERRELNPGELLGRHDEAEKTLTESSKPCLPPRPWKRWFLRWCSVKDPSHGLSRASFWQIFPFSLQPFLLDGVFMEGTTQQPG